MPRPSQPRSVGAEDNLAERIAYERERRDLSYEALAKLVTEAGCPMQGSAIFKTENEVDGKRRRVTVDEMVALARVFEVPIEDMLRPIDEIRDECVRDLVDRLQPLADALDGALYDLKELFADVFELGWTDPEIREYLDGHWFATEPPSTLFRSIKVDDEDADLTRLRDARDEIVDAIQETGKRIAHYRLMGERLDEAENV